MMRRRRNPGDPAGRRVTPGQYPALVAFFAGYLHEDLLPEHGSVAQAARAFQADAASFERDAVEQEMRRLLTETEGWPLDDLRRAVTALGAAWRPASRAELEALLQPGTDPT